MIEFRYDSSVSKAITLASVVVLAAVMFVTAGTFFSAGVVTPMATVQTAQAQLLEHGLGLTKVCLKVEAGDSSDCFYTAHNLDDFDDSLTLLDACDTMNLVQHCMSTNSNIEIVFVDDNAPAGDTTCDAATDVLPCVIGPDDEVQFHDASFIMNETTPDQASVNWQDNCDDPDTLACDPDAVNTSTAPSIQTVINPSISVVKSLNTTKVLSGEPIEVTANVTNTGDVELTGVNATDSEAGALVCGDTTLSPDESTLCTGTFNPTQSGTNTVSVEGAHQLGDATDEDSEDFTVIDASIDVVKSLNTTKVTEGGAIEVTANVTNTGNTELTGLVSIDTEAGVLSCDDTTLSPDESTLCTGTFNPVSDGTNTVNATANFQLGSVTDEDSEDFRVISPSILVEKTCDPETQTEPGTITTIINTTNTGNVDLDVTVVDDVFGTIFTGTLAPGESNVTTIIQNNLPAGVYANTVNATGEYQLGTVESQASASCEVEAGGNEGLTPGFWKANAENWDAVAWEVEDPSDDFNTVFGTNISIRIQKTIISDPTLLEALSATGGVNADKGVYDALARHCVAAKLNSEHSEIEYPLSTAEVIDACSDAINTGTATIDGTDYTPSELKDLLDGYNNLGGGVDQHNNPI